MKDGTVRVVQISDAHHFSDINGSLLGVNTHASFSALIDVLKKDPIQPNLLLLSGDLSQDASERSYIHIADAMKDFPIPTYWVPGNHDDPQVMARVYPRATISNLKHIVLEHWQIILLDSHKNKSVEGFLDATQLTFLEDCLKQHPEQHAIVVFHHHPVKVGCEWLDNIGLTNADQLWPILKRYKQVKTVLFGHVHQQIEGEKEGIHYYSVPSTCIQFKGKSDSFALEKIPPAYRWLDLYPHGELKTAVCRAADYIGEFDEQAKGY